MYTIQSLSKPHDISFSRNPVLWRFRLFPFSQSEVNARLRLCLSVHIETYFGSGVYDEVWTGHEFPNARGLVSIDIQTILDAHLEFYTPDPNIVKFHRCKNQSKHYFVRYWYQSESGAISTPVDSAVLIAAKGGMSKEEFHPSQFFVKNVAVKKQSLHFWHDQERIRETETKWLFFMTINPSEEKLKLLVNLFDNAGAQIGPYTAFEQNINTAAGEIFCVPLSLEVLAVAANTPPGTVIRTVAPIVVDNVFEEFTKVVNLDIDYRPFYDARYIYFRNSLGGLDVQPLLGEKELGISIAAQKAELVKRPELLQLFQIQNEQPVYFSTQQPGTLGHTGWIPLPQLEKLRDLLLNKQVYEPYGRRLRPLTLNTDKTKLWKSGDKLYNLAIEYATAFTDVNYSPELVLAQGNTCPAVTVLALSQEVGRFMHIHWELPPGYDKIQIDWIVGTTTTTVYYLGQIGDADIQIFPTAIPATPKTVTVNARVVCNDEVAPFSYGPYTSAHINIYPTLAPIAVPDAVDELPRVAGAYMLKQGGVELDFRINDIPRNGGSITDVENIYDAGGLVTTFSANGATVSIWPNGKIKYLSTLATLAITTEDYFFYKCREMVGMVSHVSGLAKIVVPIKAQIPKVFVQLWMDPNGTTAHIPYGLAGAYSLSNYVSNVFARFFLDIACTIPVDVTGWGITIAWQYYERIKHYNAIGNVTSATQGFQPPVSMLCSGSSMLIDPQKAIVDIINPLPIGCDRKETNYVFRPDLSIGDIIPLQWQY